MENERVLDEKYFVGTRNSIANLGKQVTKKEHEFIYDMFDFINDECENNDDMFFYDMMEFIRIIREPGHIAYTTPDRLISLNTPGKPGMDTGIWEFIFEHECLHQLWDTFGVEDEIKKAGLEYDHTLLNIASDCVINDYLEHIRKKKPFKDGIFPDVIKKEYGVEYDRKRDTQFSLYCKLLKSPKKPQNPPQDPMSQGNDDHQQSSNPGNQGQGQQGQGQQGQGQQGQGQQGQGQNGQGQQGQGQQGQGQQGQGQNGQGQQGQSQNGQGQQGQGQNGQGQQGQGQNGQGQQGQGQQGQNGQGQNGQGQQGQGQNGQGQQGQGQQGQGQQGQGQQGQGQQGQGQNGQKGKPGNSGGSAPDLNDELSASEVKKAADAIIKKYRDKLSGALGDFISKCKSSQKMEKSDYGAKTNSRGVSGMKELDHVINARVKKKIFNAKRQYKSTFSRLKRGFVAKEGEMLQQGRIPKENTLNICISFYVDVSGSMSDCIDSVQTALNTISDDVIKKYKKDSAVSSIGVKFFAFNERIYEINRKTRLCASGGTCSLDNLFDHIETNCNNCLVNIILTDGSMNVNKSELNSSLKNIDGCVIFITNEPNNEVKQYAKTTNAQVTYIQADSNFN